jgi:hypothetical protein
LSLRRLAKHPGLDNHAMGTIFEERVCRFNEGNNEESGEHWTPRDAVKLNVYNAGWRVLHKKVWLDRQPMRTHTLTPRRSQCAWEIEGRISGSDFAEPLPKLSATIRGDRSITRRSLLAICLIVNETGR